MLKRLREPISPETYRRITVAALVLLVCIVVTGAAVRLTGSGLGCTDWPQCTDTTFTPSSDIHAQIEFANRLVTGLVSAAVILAVLGSLRRSPRRRDLTVLSLGLVAGVLGQIVLGGLVVLTHLNPWLVQGHFVLSMVLVANAVVLAHRAGQPDDAIRRPATDPTSLRLVNALVAVAIVVLATGTLVTGSGPHSGHSEAEPGATRSEQLEAATEVRRLPIEVHVAARIHGASMIGFGLLAVATSLRLRRQGSPRVTRASSTLVTVIVLQGAIGYTQYFTDVPPLLVGLHVFGACLVWVAVLHLRLCSREPVLTPATERAESGGGTQRPDGFADRDLVARPR